MTFIETLVTQGAGLISEAAWTSLLSLGHSYTTLLFVVLCFAVIDVVLIIVLGEYEARRDRQRKQLGTIRKNETPLGGVQLAVAPPRSNAVPPQLVVEIPPSAADPPQPAVSLPFEGTVLTPRVENGMVATAREQPGQPGHFSEVDLEDVARRAGLDVKILEGWVEQIKRRNEGVGTEESGT